MNTSDTHETQYLQGELKLERSKLDIKITETQHKFSITSLMNENIVNNKRFVQTAVTHFKKEKENQKYTYYNQ